MSASISNQTRPTTMKTALLALSVLFLSCGGRTEASGMLTTEDSPTDADAGVSLGAGGHVSPAAAADVVESGSERDAGIDAVLPKLEGASGVVPSRGGSTGPGGSGTGGKLAATRGAGGSAGKGGGLGEQSHALGGSMQAGGQLATGGSDQLGGYAEAGGTKVARGGSAGSTGGALSRGGAAGSGGLAAGGMAGMGGAPGVGGAGGFLSASGGAAGTGGSGPGYICDGPRPENANYACSCSLVDNPAIYGSSGSTCITPPGMVACCTRWTMEGYDLCNCEYRGQHDCEKINRTEGMSCP